MATYGPVARALLEEGCSPEQVAAAVSALEQAREREREERLARLREGARLRQQRCRERRRAARRAMSRCDDAQPPSLEVSPKDNNQTPFLTPSSPARPPSPAESAPASSAAVHLLRNSPEGAAWWAYRKATTGRFPPTDKRGGWYFPSKWPPRERSPPAEP